METTRIQCPACGKRLKIGQTPAPGAKIQCPKCAKTFAYQPEARHGAGSDNAVQAPAHFMRVQPQPESRSIMGMAVLAVSMLALGGVLVGLPMAWYFSRQKPPVVGQAGEDAAAADPDADNAKGGNQTPPSGNGPGTNVGPGDAPGENPPENGTPNGDASGNVEISPDHGNNVPLPKDPNPDNGTGNGNPDNNNSVDNPAEGDSPPLVEGQNPGAFVQAAGHQELKVHDNPIQGICYSPDGRWLATNDSSGKLIVWDLSQQKYTVLRETGVFGDSNSAPCQPPMRFSTDSTRLVAGNAQALFVFDLAKRAQVKMWGSPDYGDGSPWISANAATGALMQGESDKRELVIYDLALGKERGRIPGNAQVVAVSSGGELVAVSGGDKIVQLFDCQTDKLGTPIQGFAANINGLWFTPDNQRLFVAESSQKTTVWDVSQPAGRAKLLKTIENLQLLPHGTQPAVSADGVQFFHRPANYQTESALMATHGDPRATLWNSSTYKDTLAIACVGRPESVLASPDGKWYLGLESDRMVLFDGESGRVRYTLGPRGNSDYNLQQTGACAFGPDSQTFAMGRKDGTVILRALPKIQLPAPVAVLPIESDPAREDDEPSFSESVGLAFSADNQSLLTVANHWSAVWDLATASQRFIASAPDSTGTAGILTRPRSYAVLHSDTLLLFAQANDVEGFFTLDLMTGDVKQPVSGKARFFGMATSPDSNLVVAQFQVTGEQNTLLSVLEPREGKQVHLLSDKASGVNMAHSAFTQDSSLLAVEESGKIRLWELSTGAAHPLVITQNGITGLGFVAQDKQLVTCDTYGVARFYDLESGQELRTLECLPAIAGNLKAAYFLAKRPLAILVGGEGEAVVISTETGDQVARLEGHFGEVLGGALSADGSRFASFGGKSQDQYDVRIWNLDELEAGP